MLLMGKTYPYGIKGILRHNNYQSDPKAGLGIVTIRRISCSCHDCTTILFLYCYSNIK